LVEYVFQDSQKVLTARGKKASLPSARGNALGKHLISGSAEVGALDGSCNVIVVVIKLPWSSNE
jgi:hypothetical protein